MYVFISAMELLVRARTMAYRAVQTRRLPGPPLAKPAPMPMKRPVPIVPPMERSWTCLLLRRRWRPSAFPLSVSMGEGEAALLEAFSPSEDMMMYGRGVLVVADQSETRIPSEVNLGLMIMWGERRKKDTEEGRTKEKKKSESKGFYCRSYLWEAKLGAPPSVTPTPQLSTWHQLRGSSSQWREVLTQWVTND